MSKKEKKNEVIFEEIMNDIQRATIKGKVVHGKVFNKNKKAKEDKEVGQND